MSLAARMQERGFDSDDESVASNASVEATKRRRWSVWTIVSTAFLQVRVYLQLSWKNIAAHPCTFILGVVSCLIVTLITALMLTVMGRLPIVFMRLAELEQGEADLRVFASGQAAGAVSLNYSKILSLPQFSMPGAPASFNTMRVEFPQETTTFWPLTACRNATTSLIASDPSTFGFLWLPNPAVNVTSPPGTPAGSGNEADRCPASTGCPDEYCDGTHKYAAALTALDFGREQRMGLGRAFTASAPPPGSCVMHNTVAERLNVRPGDYVLVAFEAAERMLQAYLDAELNNWPDKPYTTYSRVMMPLRVAELVNDGGGKFAADFDRFVLLDVAGTLAYMAPYLNPEVSLRKRQLFARADIQDNANQVIFNFPPDERTDVYAQRDAQDVLASATAFATPIIATLGFNQVGTDMAIVKYIQDNSFFSLFLGLILSLLILGLGFLCIVLIHSLLTVGVETRTFELGIMRMVGMTRPMLTGYVITGALLFAIPAWVLGLIIAQGAFAALVGYFSDSLGVELPATLTPDAIGYATLVGLGMPLVSAIAPIISVLALDLPTALDTNRARTNAITYDIRRGGEYHINWLAAAIGLAMTVAGFLVYYLFPLALITFNITLLFYIFFGILMGMLFGLVLLTTSLQGLAEIVVMYVFLWWESAAVFQLMRKNLIAHRVRNRKTALMFAMSIGFLIFISVTAAIQVESVIYQTERFYGGPINVRARGSNSALPYYVMDACDIALRELQANQLPYLRWTYSGADLDLQSRLDNATIATVGRYVEWDPRITFVAPNYWEVAMDKYFIADGVRDARWPLAESLYSYDGSGRSVISTAMRKSFALTNFDEAFLLMIIRQVDNGTETEMSLSQSEAWLDSSPGLAFSKYSVALGRYVLMSPPALQKRARGSVLSMETLNFDELIVMANEGDVPMVEGVLAGVVQRLGVTNRVEVRNFYDTRERLGVATSVLNIFFVFAQTMATFICFFALSSSMATNIHEQSKEIGVLRCIGLRKAPLTRAYVWEAFVLVFAASFLGICVGVLMGYTIVLQRALFTQLPLPFVFPWIQLLLVLGLSMLLAFLSSFWPIRALLRTKAVSTIMRRIV